MAVGVAPMSGSTGASGVGASSLPRAGASTAEVPSMGRYTTTNTSSGIPMTHTGPPGPAAPTMHTMGQLGTDIIQNINQHRFVVALSKPR